MKKYIRVAWGLLMCGLCIQTAQSQSELTVSLGAGSSTLNYQTDYGKSKSGSGGALGVGYSYFFSRTVGISLGLEAEMFNSSVDMGTVAFDQAIPAPAGLLGHFSLQANYAGLKEKQTAVVLQIPVMLQFQFPVGDQTALFVGAGVKAGFPVSSKWNQSADRLTTTGYSDYTGQHYTDMPNHGFSTYSTISASGKLELKSPVMLALEGGLKFGIGEGKALYAGIFLDYGLSDMYKAAAANTPLLVYNNAPSVTYSYNSVLATNHYSASGGIKPFAVGLKIKMGFGSGNMAKPNKAEKVEKPVNPVKKTEKPVNPVKKTEVSKKQKTEQKIVPVGD